MIVLWCICIFVVMLVVVLWVGRGMVSWWILLLLIFIVLLVGVLLRIGILRIILFC